MHYLLFGLIFGLCNGLSPGPTLTLVISKTLQYNLKAGVQIAVSPIIFGVVVIPISMMTISALSTIKPIIGVIVLIGISYLIYLSIDLIKQPTQPVAAPKKNKHYRTGALVNFFSPFPYIFWFSVGGPLLVKAFNTSFIFGTLFILSYYTALIGSKITIALIANKSKTFYTQKTYKNITRSLGIIMLFFAILFIKIGLEYL